LVPGSVVKINSVKQGGITYTPDVDYKLLASQVDWSLEGREVAPGSLYEVDYEYISTEQVQDQTSKDFAIEGAVKDAVMYVDYEFAMRRIDMIVINDQAQLNIVKGVPAEWQPIKPSVPAGLLALASIEQTWDERRMVRLDQVRMVSMDRHVANQARMDDIELDLAELRLSTDLSGRYGGLKKGYFADPMLDNSLRDQGYEQTALIAGGALQLFEDVDALLLGDGATAYTIDYAVVVGMAQGANTQDMTVTPPTVPPPVEPLPASVALVPAVDRWQEAQQLSYPGSFPYIVGINGSDAFENQLDNNGNRLNASKLGKVFMREIEVAFKLLGFKPGELLQQVTFDGQVVTARPAAGGTLVANARGEIAGALTVPPKLPTGTKVVAFAGNQASQATAQFTAQAEVKVSINIMNHVGTSSSFGWKVVTYVV